MSNDPFIEVIREIGELLRRSGLEAPQYGDDLSAALSIVRKGIQGIYRQSVEDLERRSYDDGRLKRELDETRAALAKCREERAELSGQLRELKKC